MVTEVKKYITHLINCAIKVYTKDTCENSAIQVNFCILKPPTQKIHPNGKGV